MKKIINIILLLSLSSCLHHHSQYISGLEGKQLPAFNLLLSDSATFLNTATLPSGKPFILFCFEPSCPHCNAEVDDILINMEAFKSIRFYMVTPFSFGEMKAFYDRHHLSKYPNVVIAMDKQNNVLTHFKANRVPYLAVFDKDRKLKEVLIGRQDINYIKSIVLD